MQLFTTFTTLSYHSTTVTFHCDVFSCRASAAQEVEWIIHQSEGQWRPSSDTVNPGLLPMTAPSACEWLNAETSRAGSALCIAAYAISALKYVYVNG